MQILFHFTYGTSASSDIGTHGGGGGGGGCPGTNPLQICSDDCTVLINRGLVMHCSDSLLVTMDVSRTRKGFD